MNYQYYTKEEFKKIGFLLLPYSGVFESKKQAIEWKEIFEEETLSKLRIPRHLILAEAAEEKHIDQEKARWKKAIEEVKSINSINYEEQD